MKILLTGAAGLVGRALTPALTAAGHTVVKLSRGGAAPSWNPAAGSCDAAELAGCEGVIHLAGEGIADGRWTAAKMQRIRDSRVNGTKLLCETLARLPTPPQVLLSASAIGWYGDRGAEELSETAAPGAGFLADVCQRWELATQPLAATGARVVNTRIGVVISRDGGALKKMLLPFQLGVGGILGGGKQYMSWIAIDDIVGALLHLLKTDVRGPVNLTAPTPLSNYGFMKTLGKVLGRPTIFPLPAFAARLAFGKMADEILLTGQRVLPKQLQAGGYQFRYPDLETALKHVLGK